MNEQMIHTGVSELEKMRPSSPRYYGISMVINVISIVLLVGMILVQNSQKLFTITIGKSSFSPVIPLCFSIFVSLIWVMREVHMAKKGMDEAQNAKEFEEKIDAALNIYKVSFINLLGVVIGWSVYLSVLFLL